MYYLKLKDTITYLNIINYIKIQVYDKIKKLFTYAHY